MYSETKKPGAKQFFSGLLMMLAVYTLGCILNAALKSLPLLRAALIFFMCCGAVYLVYVRCGVQYTYSLGKKGISAGAVSGRKSSSVTVPYKKICSVKMGWNRVPFSHKTYINSIFPNKNCCCILYDKGKNALIIEASDTFYEKLKEHIK